MKFAKVATLLLCGSAAGLLAGCIEVGQVIPLDDAAKAIGVPKIKLVLHNTAHGAVRHRPVPDGEILQGDCAAVERRVRDGAVRAICAHRASRRQPLCTRRNRGPHRDKLPPTSRMPGVMDRRSARPAPARITACCSEPRGRRLCDRRLATCSARSATRNRSPRHRAGNGRCQRRAARPRRRHGSTRAATAPSAHDRREASDQGSRRKIAEAASRACLELPLFKAMAHLTAASLSRR